MAEKRAFLATLTIVDGSLMVSTLAQPETLYGRLRCNDEETVQANGGVNPDYTDDFDRVDGLGKHMT